MLNIIKIITIRKFLFIFYKIYGSFSQYNFITQKFKIFVSNRTIFSEILICCHQSQNKEKITTKVYKWNKQKETINYKINNSSNTNIRDYEFVRNGRESKRTIKDNN